MRPRARCGSIAARTMVVVLLATAFAGCSSPAPDAEPHLRIKSIGMSNSGGSTCLPLTSPRPFEWCIVSDARFTDFDCNPPQAAFSGFTQLGLSSSASRQPEQQRTSVQEPAGTNDAYVYCEYAFFWKVTARSLMPDASFTVTARHAGMNETKSCQLGSSGECSVTGWIDGAFRFDGPGNEVQLLATWEGQARGLDGQPVQLPGGQASGTQDWHIGT